jgi:hypothetical protein
VHPMASTAAAWGLQPASQRRVDAVDLIGGHQAAGTCAGRARSSICLASSGLVATCSGIPAAVGVGGPAAGQVQRLVDQRVPAPAGVGQGDRDLGVVDLAAGAGVLASHSEGGVPFWQSPLSSITRTASGSPRGRSGRRARRHAPCRRPTPPAEQVLHTLGLASPACSASVQQCLGGRSASSPHTTPLTRRRGSTWVNRPAIGPAAHPGGRPAGGVYAVARGHRLIVGCPHNTR